MFEARIICSGADCEEELEVLIEDLSELDGLVCECGYGFELLWITQVELLPARRPRPASRRLAA